MAERVVRSGDFHEWWDRKGAPQGSAHFKGAAGVMGMAVVRLQAWAAAHRS
jgi:hypothetical protein